MSNRTGRSGTPGNSTTYRSVNIITSNPLALQPANVASRKNASRPSTGTVRRRGNGPFELRRRG